jgi:hypothetical protein
LAHYASDYTGFHDLFELCAMESWIPNHRYTQKRIAGQDQLCYSFIFDVYGDIFPSDYASFCNNNSSELEL